MKHDQSESYLVSETTGDKDRTRVRFSEAGKFVCGEKHFKTLGVNFDVVVEEDEVLYEF